MRKGYFKIGYAESEQLVLPTLTVKFSIVKTDDACGVTGSCNTQFKPK